VVAEPGQPGGDPAHPVRAVEAEHQQVVAGRGRAGAARVVLGELQVVARAGHAEQHPAVAGVPGEPFQLGQPETVPVERDQLVEPVGRARDAHLTGRQQGRPWRRVHGASPSHLTGKAIDRRENPRLVSRM
jgi:hypothetical protein